MVQLKMKIKLSQWTESVRHSVRKMQNDPQKIWVKSVPLLPPPTICSQSTSAPSPSPTLMSWTPDQDDRMSDRVKAVLKYKKVDQKIRPIPTKIPSHMKVHRKLPEDPPQDLTSPPLLSPGILPYRQGLHGKDDQPGY